MAQPLRLAWTRMTRDPARGVVLLLAFALNAAVLALVLSVFLSFRLQVNSTLLRPGTAVWIYTLQATDPGTRQKRVQIHTSWLPDLKEASGLRFLSPFDNSPWSGVTVGLATLPYYGMGVYPDYARICELELIAGSFFSDDEAARNDPVAVVSEEVARAVWGGPEAAIGATFTSVIPKDSLPGLTPRTYTVVGVYAGQSELRTRFFIIASIFVPYVYPVSGMDIAYSLRGWSPDPSLARVQRRFRRALETTHNMDPEATLDIWEGSFWDLWGTSDAALLGRIRMVSTFFAVMWVFALLVLAFGVLALLSSDTTARLRETGLRRALGSTRLRVVGLFASEAAVIVVAANLLGAGLVAAFVGPLLDAVKPLLAGGGPLEEVVLSSRSVWIAIAASLGATVAMGAMGSLYPAHIATRVGPSDALREL